MLSLITIKKVLVSTFYLCVRVCHYISLLLALNQNIISYECCQILALCIKAQIIMVTGAFQRIYLFITNS